MEKWLVLSYLKKKEQVMSGMFEKWWSNMNGHGHCQFVWNLCRLHNIGFDDGFSFGQHIVHCSFFSYTTRKYICTGVFDIYV